MATNPIGGESAIVTLPGMFPPAATGHIAASLLNRHSAHEIAEAVEVLVELLDLLGGDPEAEAATWPNDIHSRAEPALPDDFEPAGDEQDAAWAEWHTRGRHKLAGGIKEPFDRAGEDNEDDDPDSSVEDNPEGFDPEEDRCLAGDDCIMSGPINCGGGFPWMDLGPGEADDAEREQMGNDVPMLPVVSLEYNPFTDKRLSLGISNLQASFRGGEIRSADTGNVLRTNWRAPLAPGVPV